MGGGGSRMAVVNRVWAQGCARQFADDWGIIDMPRRNNRKSTARVEAPVLVSETTNLGYSSVNPLIQLIQEHYRDTLQERPNGALTMEEMVVQTGKSRYQIERFLGHLKEQGKIKSARVSKPGGFEVVYWQE